MIAVQAHPTFLIRKALACQGNGSSKSFVERDTVLLALNSALWVVIAELLGSEVGGCWELASSAQDDKVRSWAFLIFVEVVRNAFIEEAQRLVHARARRTKDNTHLIHVLSPL